MCCLCLYLSKKMRKLFPKRLLNPLILNVMLHVVCMDYSTMKYILEGLLLMKQIVCIEVYQKTNEQKVSKELEDDIVEYSTC